MFSKSVDRNKLFSKLNHVTSMFSKNSSNSNEPQREMRGDFIASKRNDLEKYKKHPEHSFKVKHF